MHCGELTSHVRGPGCHLQQTLLGKKKKELVVFICSSFFLRTQRTCLLILLSLGFYHTLGSFHSFVSNASTAFLLLLFLLCLFWSTSTSPLAPVLLLLHLSLCLFPYSPFSSFPESVPSFTVFIGKRHFSQS